MSALGARLEVDLPAGARHAFYPEPAVERAMKTQEVILRAMANLPIDRTG
ncbi:MAG TPA: hypothetical protein VEJ45_04705 [Candidatus Acidoferrales bacterium]|nr:hypothetical protein [Candidatus Acidoferrales bacterium]